MKQTAFRAGLVLLLGILLLFPRALFAASDPGSSIPLRQQIKQILDREGYIGRYRNGQELQRGISAYLWDYRHWLKSSNFHNSKKLEVLACLMIKRGYPGFETYAESQSFMKTCQQLVK